MPRLQLLLIVILILLPIALFAGVGAWAIWQSGHMFWLSWMMPVCWGLVWVLLRRAKSVEVALPEIGSRIHWTPHDKAAGEIVTGVLHVDPEPEDLHAHLGTIESPFNKLGEKELCPGSAALEQFNAAHR